MTWSLTVSSPLAARPARSDDWPVTRHGWRLRRIGNVANLSTPLGVAVALTGRARLRSGPGGLLLAEGYRRRFPAARAFTIGDVVITRGRFGVHDDRLLAHEGRHAWQWLALGPGFVPVYCAAMTWSWWRTGDRASANPFERWAGLADGGYLGPQIAIKLTDQ